MCIIYVSRIFEYDTHVFYGGNLETRVNGYA